MEVGNSRHASFQVLVMFDIHYKRIHPARALGKIDRDLCQKRLFPLWTLWFVNRKCAVFVILFWCYCRFLVLMYRVVLIGVEFVEIHPGMSKVKTKLFFVQIVAVLFLIASWRSQYLLFPIFLKVLLSWDTKQLWTESFFLFFRELPIPYISHILKRFANFSEYFEPFCAVLLWPTLFWIVCLPLKY